MSKTTQNINSVFFQGIYKDVWRQLIPPGLTEAETDFIEEVANLQEGNHMLDLMCGYGRHSIELAKRGYEVTAIDTETEYIGEIKEVATNNNLKLHARRGDVTAIEFSETFDASICMGNSFAFLDENEAIDVLKQIAAHLKKGGVFILNTWMLGEIAIKYFKDRDWFYAGEYKYLIENKYLLYPTRIEAEHIIISKNGDIETIKGIDYIFTIAEMQKQLETTGFKLRGIYSTPRKRIFKIGDTRAYVVAEKL
jgi:SAM-dependent methyltransferase